MRIIVSIFLMPLCITFLYAQAFYVAPWGDNSNPGTLEQPWETLQMACNSAIPGSTVFLRQGTYAGAWLNVSGAPGQLITFTNYENELAVIDGGSTGEQTSLFFIDGHSHIRIEGLRFQNAMGPFSSAIYIRDGADDIQIVNNVISDIHFSVDPLAEVTPDSNANPFIVYNENPTDACQDISVVGNEIYNCRTGYSEALTFDGNVDGILVQGNTVHDITNIGIDLIGGYGTSSDPATDMARNGLVTENVVYNCVSDYAVSAGIYVDGGHDITVERNISHHNGRGFELGCEQAGHTAERVVMRQNIAHHNLESGMQIGGYDYPAGSGFVHSCTLSGNTLYSNNTLNIYRGALLIEYTEDCTIENNLIFLDPAETERLLIINRLNSLRLTLDHNLYYFVGGTTAARVDWNGVVTNFDTYLDNTGQDANSIFSDPLLANPIGEDFSLDILSPAINQGAPDYQAEEEERDYDGVRRLVGRLDIGAHEFAGPCQSNVILTDDISTIRFHHSQNTLSATNTILEGAEVYMSAADHLEFLPDFEVKEGSLLTVEPNPCPQD